jgi:hypothetical protein
MIITKSCSDLSVSVMSHPASAGATNASSGLTTHCGSDALALYLLLLTVSDSRGLSFYSDASLSRLLGLDPMALAAARDQLVAADLVAFLKPHYQVLSLPEASSPPPSQRTGQVASVGEILRRVLQPGGVR